MDTDEKTQKSREAEEIRNRLLSRVNSICQEAENELQALQRE